MLWWSLFSRSMKTLTALTFSQRVWKGWAWHDATPREEVHFPSSSNKAAQVTDMRTVHAVMLEESNYFNSFYYVISMCPVRWPMYEVCMLLVSRDAWIVFRPSLGLWRRIVSNIGGVRSAWGRGWRVQPAWLSLVVLLLIFNTYLRGFCRIHRATKSTLVRIC